MAKVCGRHRRSCHQSRGRLVPCQSAIEPGLTATREPAPSHGLLLHIGRKITPVLPRLEHSIVFQARLWEFRSVIRLSLKMTDGFSQRLPFRKSILATLVVSRRQEGDTL